MFARRWRVRCRLPMIGEKMIEMKKDNLVCEVVLFSIKFLRIFQGLFLKVPEMGFGAKLQLPLAYHFSSKIPMTARTSSSVA